jgi:hypothetical protein
MAKNEVAENKDNAVAEYLFDEADVGAGFETADRESFAVPFLRILQSGSPQCKRSEGGYIKGAEEGNIINTVTNDLYDGDVGIEVIPCAYSRNLIEWTPREEGGGFVASHAFDKALVDSCVDSDGGKLLLPNGNLLVDTRTHYVLLLTGEAIAPAIIAMTSTQLKKSRQWMSMMQQKRINIGGVPKPAPMFAYSYHMTTVPESNDHGAWFGWRVGAATQVTDPNLAVEARGLRSVIMDGLAEVDMSQAA